MNLFGKGLLGIFIVCWCLQFNGAGSVFLADAQSSGTSPAGQGPVVQVDAPSHAYGKVKNQQEIEHSFLVRNIGTADLEISKVQVS